MQIRLARPEDAHGLWSAEVVTAEVPGQLVSRPDELSLSAFERRIRELEKTGCYVVATSEDDNLLGHASVEPMPLAALRHVFRLTIVVHPGRTGRGVGTALLQHVQAWATLKPDLRKIELLVRRSNARAIRLYERLGFVEEGILRDRVRLPSGDFVDDVAMAWFPALLPD
jgi:RimJ/RimL family protein N-acetyltransferase